MTRVNGLSSDGVLLTRHQIGDPIADVPQKIFGPRIEADDSLCIACGRFFAKGDRTVLVPIGPGPDPEAQEKAYQGRWFNAVAVELHVLCAGAYDDAPADA